jgi:myo-inositol 2-dehydrogenase/D-chiro-inositol 1-dehydrogenase
VGTIEFEDGRLAVLYASRTMAHGHDTQTEVIGTAGALSVGRNPRANRVEIADAHGMRNACTPTFFERFEDAFLREAQAFVALLRDGTPTGLTLEDAREATRIGIAMRDAYESGRAVEL